MKYREFFQIIIDHPYFSSDQMDLSLIPDELTIQTLRAQGFVIKNTAKGLKVLIPLDTKGNKLPIIKPEDTVSFCVIPTTVNCSEVTDTSMVERGNILLFTNKEIKNGNEELVVSETTADSVRSSFTAIAKIKIQLNKVNFDRDEASPIYRVVFKSKSVKWKYYILSSTEASTLAIKDRGERLIFSELENQEAAADNIVNALKSNFPDSQLFVFESSTAIHYSDKILKNIQLIKNENMIIKHLSNPGISDKGIQIIKIN